MIKTFRGKLADGGQDTIRLSTNNGLIGYRIKKFEIFPEFPGTEQCESTVQIFSREQTSVSTTTATVDFINPLLLAAAFYSKSASVDHSTSLIVTFDHVTINQDIFITHTETAGTQNCNYYLELEQVKLAQNEAAVATLKDMRGAN